MAFAACLAALHLPVTAAALPAPGDAGAADAASTKKAVELFKKGQGLYKANKFADALPVLRESYQLVPSPNSQILIARCLAGSGDPVGAYLELEALIADVDKRGDPKYTPTRDAAVQERSDLAAKSLALVTVTVNNATADARVSVGLKEIPREQWGKATPVLPGSVEVTLTAPPAEPKRQTLQLTAGQKESVTLDAAPVTDAGKETPSSGGGSRLLRPLSYAFAGVGVAGMAVFGVAGGLATANYSDLEGKCSSGTGTRFCPASAQGQIDDGKVQKDIANIGLVVGAVGLAAGVTLFVLSVTTGKKDEAPQAAPVVGPGYLGVQGTF